MEVLKRSTSLNNEHNKIRQSEIFLYMNSTRNFRDDAATGKLVGLCTEIDDHPPAAPSAVRKCL